MKWVLFGAIGFGILLGGWLWISQTSNKKIVMEDKKEAVVEGQSCEIGVGCKPLTPEQARILREGGTELPFSHPLYTEKRAGTYYAADTMEPVFRSEQKYESGTGWPSFWAPVSEDAVMTKTDSSHGMTRTEVLTKAGGHLGHVFTDGPEPTGLRYCINGAALVFIPDETKY